MPAAAGWIEKKGERRIEKKAEKEAVWMYTGKNKMKDNPMNYWRY